MLSAYRFLQVMGPRSWRSWKRPPYLSILIMTAWLQDTWPYHSRYSRYLRYLLVPACTYGTYGTAVVPLANLIVGLHPLPPQTRPQAIPSARSEDTSADVDLIASEQFASTASGSTRREPQYSTCSRRAAFASIASAQPDHAYQGFRIFTIAAGLTQSRAHRPRARQPYGSV